jgi:hypothetical protein
LSGRAPYTRVVTVLRQPIEGCGGNLQPDLALRQAPAQQIELNLRDAPHVLRLQPVKHQRLVDAIEKFRTERLLEHGFDRQLDLDVGGSAVTQLLQAIAAEVAGHHDQRVLEVDRAALAIGQAPVVEHLQQDVEHVRMGLLDLVEQDHGVGAAMHRLGQARPRRSRRSRAARRSAAPPSASP